MIPVRWMAPLQQVSATTISTTEGRAIDFEWGCPVIFETDFEWFFFHSFFCNHHTTQSKWSQLIWNYQRKKLIILKYLVDVFSLFLLWKVTLKKFILILFINIFYIPSYSINTPWTYLCVAYAIHPILANFYHMFIGILKFGIKLLCSQWIL